MSLVKVIATLVTEEEGRCDSQRRTSDVSWEDEFSHNNIKVGGTTRINWQPESVRTLLASLLDGPAGRNKILFLRKKEEKSCYWTRTERVRQVFAWSREQRTGSQWELNEPGPAPHWPRSASRCVKRPRDGLNGLHRQGQCLGNTAGCLVVMGQCETSRMHQAHTHMSADLILGVTPDGLLWYCGVVINCGNYSASLTYGYL